MTGANGLKAGFLKGEILLNTDSEQEYEIYVGCAGGINIQASFRYRDEPVNSDNDEAYSITVSGLKGGHSGIDIHLGRANANKLLFRFLKEVVSDYEVRLSSVSGGNMRNAIPREATAIVTLPSDDVPDFMEAVDEYARVLADEYALIEDGLSFKVEKAAMPSTWIPEPVQDDLINAVVACHDGVLRRVPGAPDMIETSSNLAIVQSGDGAIDVTFLARSSSESMKAYLVSMIESTFLLAGARNIGGISRLAKRLEFSVPERGEKSSSRYARYRPADNDYPCRIGMRYHRGKISRDGDDFVRAYFAPPAFSR